MTTLSQCPDRQSGSAIARYMRMDVRGGEAINSPTGLNGRSMGRFLRVACDTCRIRS